MTDDVRIGLQWLDYPGTAVKALADRVGVRRVIREIANVVAERGRDRIVPKDAADVVVDVLTSAMEEYPEEKC